MEVILPFCTDEKLVVFQGFQEHILRPDDRAKIYLEGAPTHYSEEGLHVAHEVCK